MTEKINFVTADAEEMSASAKILVEQVLGRKIQTSDPLYLFTQSLLSIIIQQRLLIDELSNQNLLYYATGANLEAMGELVGIKRKSASAAICTVEIELSAARTKQTVIPAGTRFNAGDNVNFALIEDCIFLSGETLKTASAQCLTAGEVGNNYAVGELKRIVDYSPYLKSIKNITESEGGADVETDDDLRERIRIAPESFSVAGSRGAYEFHCKNYNASIIDCYCDSPTPGIVDVYFLMEGGEIPQAEMLQGVYNHLSADTVRPLTDYVRVFPPEIVEYDIELDYWIGIENKTRATAIVTAVEKAVADFILWQKSKIGRDLNPTELYWRIRSAGAKRAEITTPQFVGIPSNTVAICRNVNVVYQGIEDI